MKIDKYTTYRRGLFYLTYLFLPTPIPSFNFPPPLLYFPEPSTLIGIYYKRLCAPLPHPGEEGKGRLRINQKA